MNLPKERVGSNEHGTANNLERHRVLKSSTEGEVIEGGREDTTKLMFEETVNRRGKVNIVASGKKSERNERRTIFEEREDLRFEYQLIHRSQS